MIKEECIICGKQFETKSITQTLCSTKCQNKWQSLYRTKENSPNYNKNISEEQRIINCIVCNSKMRVKPYQISTKKFCSIKCKNIWMTTNVFQNSDHKKKVKKSISKFNEEHKTRLTSPHLKINKILDNLNIDYINEKAYKYYTIDIELNKNNLCIEIMGEYWHCDIRTYNQIEYETQLNRIIKDRSKNKYFNLKHKNILYLWEKDINQNIKLCELLILSFIKNNGMLENYHSFNYNIINKLLTLNDNIIYPYMTYNSKKIKQYVNLKTQKICKKQIDKWITYSCDYCKKEYEILKTHDKNINHFCSVNCYKLHRNKLTEPNKISVNCICCDNIFLISKYDYDISKTKTFYCDIKCYNKYMKTKHNIIFNCEFCKKQTSKTKADYNKSKHHFCSYKCSVEFRRL